MASKNGKEIYVASIVLLVGTIYLVAQTITLFSGGSTTVKGDSLQISINELLSHLRTIFIIVLCFTGGISMLRQKKIGWIISFAVILLLLTIAAGIYESNIPQISTGGVIIIAGIIMLLIAMIFLIQKTTRERYQIENKNYYSVIIIYAVLVLFYFYLQ